MDRNKQDIFTGVWPALFTPLDNEGKLNEAELEKLIEMLIGEKVDGLYLLGSTGQGFLFSEEERKKITEITLRINAERLPVMVQVGSLSTAESVRLAIHAQDRGADAISSVGPIYYGASVNMAFQHYKKIAEATDLPFFPYQIGASASIELIERLKTLRTITGMKLTTQKLLDISNIHNNVVGSGWKLFSGADELLCHAALCGASGAIGTTYNLIGSTCKKVRRQFLEGQVVMAKNFMLEFQKLIEEIMPYIWTFFRRAMQLKHGIDIGNPRQPLLPEKMPLSDEQTLDMIQRLETLAGAGKLNASSIQTNNQYKNS